MTPYFGGDKGQPSELLDFMCDIYALDPIPREKVKAAYSATFIKTDQQNSRTNRRIFIFLAVLQRKKRYVKTPDIRIGYGKMLKSAHCKIQLCLSIFVFFRRRDQLINLFPNKMLT